MKTALIAALAALALTLAAPGAQAAKISTPGGKACKSVGAECSTACEKDWCARYVCVGTKWEKRIPGCSPLFCPPRCS